MSGLNQRFTKPSNLNRFREFESHRLRPYKMTHQGSFLLGGGEQMNCFICVGDSKDFSFSDVNQSEKYLPM